MTASQKYEAFCNVVLQVRAIEYRAAEQRRIQASARATSAARYSELVEQRDQARKDGRFALLK